MTIVISRLADHAVKVLADILANTNEVEKEPGVDSIYYRAKHSKDRSILDALEAERLIERKHDQNYLATLLGLSILRNGKAKEILATCAKIFDVMRERYREDAKKPATVSELAIGLGLPSSEVIKALVYMRDARVWGGYSSDLSDATASVYAGETILDYHDFEDVLSKLWQQHLRTHPPTNPVVYSQPRAKKVASASKKKKAISASKRGAGVNIAVQALSDTPAPIEQDALGYGVYSSAIVDFLVHKNTRPPFSLAVTGPWGSGKTTLLDWIKKDLEGLDYKTVWFSPWKHSLQEEVWASFARTIIESLVVSPLDTIRLWWSRFKDAMPSRTTKRLSLISALIIGIVALLFSIFGDLDYLYGLLALVVPAARLLFSVWKASGSPLLKMLGSSKGPDYDQALGFKKEFEEDLSRLIRIATAKAPEKPLFIFVDDLDRAPPPVPVKLLEAMNILIGQKQCIFLMGLDLQIVGASIEAKYLPVIERLSPSTTGFSGANFIEKLVQLEFALPALTDHQVDGLLDSLLISTRRTIESLPNGANNPIPQDLSEKVQDKALASPLKQAEVTEPRFDEDSNDFTTSIYFFARCMPRNPRKIKRFINQYRLLAYIAARRGLFGSSRVDLDGLGATIVLADEYPEIYRLLFGYSFPTKFRNISKWIANDTQGGKVDDKVIQSYGLSVQSDKYRYATTLLPILIERAEHINDYLSLSSMVASEPAVN